MQSGQVLGPGSLISESARILEPIFQDAFYIVYSAEAPASGAKIGITEYFPADLVARAPSGDVLLRSLEAQDLFNLGRDRFMAEARTLSGLRHPNFLRFDGVLSDHGTAFALHAAEEGQSITGLVKSSKQPPPQENIDASLKPLISALELLHSRDLIHANITPDNVLLRPEPLLIRFGSSRSFLAARMHKVNLAVTPGYSAPELHFSDEKAHGPLCDIFSLAAVLYYVVTGRHPINVIARGLGQTMPPAAALPSQRFRPEFLAAIDRGMELDPERRPRTIKAFGEMLLGIPERKALESTQPALQLAANVAEGSQIHVPPSAVPPSGTSSAASKGVQNSSAPAPNGETDTDEEDDDFDETRDFGSSWRGLGIGRLLVLAVVLALLVSAGLWMLEAQFEKQPEQSAHLDPGKEFTSQSVGSDSPASKDQSASTGDKERFAAAKPSEQASVAPAPVAPAVAVPEPGSEIRSPEAPAKNPPATETMGPPSREAAIENPKAPQEFKAAEATVSNRSPEIPGRDPAQREVALEKQEAKNPGSEMSTLLPPDGSARDVPAKPAPFMADRTRLAAIEKPQAKEPAAAVAPPPPLEKPASKEPPTQTAKADSAPPPLPEASAASAAGFKFKDCDFCPQLVVVPKGEFMMGSNEHPHEKPAHKVRISHPFAIGQYEVTYADWDQCVEAGACRYRPEAHGSPREPIGNLSWDDANAYLKWMSEKTGQTYRLPSEAEWEYAARAGTSKRFWWGDETGSAKANCSDCGAGTNGQSSAAGSYKPNPFGLYDTAGNMAEWVEDCWNESYHGAPADGSAWIKGTCSLRGLRGGSYGSKAAYIRSSARFRYDSDVRYEANGFRVLRELR